MAFLLCEFHVNLPKEKERNGGLIQTTTWKNLTKIMLHECRQTLKACLILYDSFHMTCPEQANLQTNKDWWLPGTGGGEKMGSDY